MNTPFAVGLVGSGTGNAFVGGVGLFVIGCGLGGIKLEGTILSLTLFSGVLSTTEVLGVFKTAAPAPNIPPSFCFISDIVDDVVSSLLTDDEALPIIGAERSFVTVFFNLAPFWMALRRAELLASGISSTEIPLFGYKRA